MSVFVLYKVFEPGPKKGKEQPACLYWCVSVSFPKHLLTVCLTPCSATPSRTLLGGLSFSFYKQQGQMAALRILREQRTLLPISEIDVDWQGGSQRFLLEFLPWDSDRKEEKFMVNQALSGNTTHVSVFLVTLLHSSEPNSIIESTALFLQLVKPRSSSVQ